MNASLLAWDDSLLVNFEIIDNQHKELITIINNLIRGCNGVKAIQDVLFIKTLRKAIEYAQTHFSTEENYLRQVNYPDFPDHKQEHESFVSEVVKQLKAFEENRNDPVVLVDFLKSWLFNHIAVVDKKYAPYLAGLQA
ncbi:MAG: bacteriohemerythrin [Spirochaetaceae bacterium]|jgi:hemerythrin-like metal-binding protein|nr:bacteriohemerythrin [Spirochaetaceae bacterium]